MSVSLVGWFALSLAAGGPVATASASSSPEPAQPVPSTTTHSLAVVEGVNVNIQVPIDWKEGAAPESSMTDSIPDVEVVSSKSWLAPNRVETQLEVVCAKAPDSGWLTGTESLVLERVYLEVERQLRSRMLIEHTKRDDLIQEKGGVFLQDYRMVGNKSRFENGVRIIEEDRPGPRVRFRAYGRTILGFASSSVVVCAASCVENRNGATCVAVRDSMKLEGKLVAPPSASMWPRIKLGVVRSPATAVGVALGAAGLLAGLLLFAKGIAGLAKKSR